VISDQSWNVLWFGLFELSLFIAAIAVVIRFLGPEEDSPSSPRFLLAVLAVKLMLGGLFPIALSFLGLDQRSIYLCLIPVLLMSSLALLKDWLARAARDLAAPTAESGSQPTVPLLAFVLFATAFAPVLLGAMMPPSETDTLRNLGGVLGWIHQHTTPYIFPYNYVCLPEAGYLPAILVGRHDTLLWVVSFEAVLLFGMATYHVAQLLFSSKWLALLTAADGVALFHFWFGVSGVTTIKNDMIYNAGVLLVVLALLAILLKKNSRVNYILLACGATFVSVKYSGPVLLIGLILPFLWAARATRALSGIPVGRICSGTLFVTILGSGHFYLRNVIQHGNPLFPYKVSILGYALPGSMYYPNSSILAHWKEFEVWRLFLLTGREGWLFPIAFLGLLVLVPILFAVQLDEKKSVLLRYLSLSCCVAWLIYFASIWSAELTPGTLDMIREHYSFRYVSAADTLTKLLFGSCLIRFLPRLSWQVCGIFAADWLYRMMILYREIERVNGRLLLVPVAAFVAAIALLAGAMYIAPRRARLGLAALLPVGLLCASPTVGEINRSRWWLNDFKPVLDFLANSPPKDVAILVGNGLWPPLMYPASGQYFQHSLRFYETSELSLRMAGCQTLPDAVVVIGWQTLPEQLTREFDSQLNPCGIYLKARNYTSAVYARYLTIGLPTVSLQSLPGGPPPGRFVSDNDPGSLMNQLKVPGNEVVVGIVGDSPRVWARTSAGPVFVKGEPSARIKIRNLGGLLPGGGFSSVDLSWADSGWHFANDNLDAVGSRFAVSSLLQPGPNVNPNWIVTGAGRTTSGTSPSPDGTVFWLKAEEEMPWMAATVRDTAGTNDSTLGLEAEIRVSGGYPASGSVFTGDKLLNDIPITGTWDWSHFVLTQAFSPHMPYSFGIGLRNPPSGSVLQIRFARVVRAVLPNGVNGLYVSRSHVE
jgi:hypothetical protein